MLLNLSKTQWHLAMYTYSFICLFFSQSCTCSFAGIGLMTLAEFGQVWCQTADLIRSVQNSHFLWISGCLSYVHDEKQKCKKASPIMLAYFKLLLLLCPQTYYRLKQDMWPGPKSKGREIHHLPWRWRGLRICWMAIQIISIFTHRSLKGPTETGAGDVSEQ